ncbi:HEAT repeat domain-containing protein [Corallococcus sp. H22C18031201]|uniref:HEAT repeat domain-containing protein n=1 Tax=Citreicoccus inhibens TaxID=2849499 RepID=UPI000E746C38|nr:HEAT repeat domain-containing protein [Citreicoccus inhibens]MBU8900226.1 HEAT repeat domain-containing protein [Citreicoccus inhibens]RJS16393.1 HEAT repeat domain-containing protein [Corallococcus sp. H22C18031201]
MGLFDFLTGGSGPDKALKLKSKVTQKYGDPTTRQKAIQQLGEMKFPEAITVLLSRFTITVDPLTTDADEKEHTFELIKGFGQDAVAPLSDFLRKSDHATSWALRLLTELQSEEQVLGIVTDTLKHLSSHYTRDPEKKVVLLHAVSGKADPRVPEAVLPFLEDMSDDVKIAALKSLGGLKHESTREPMLKLLTSEETGRRVQTAALGALADCGFSVKGFQEKVQALLVEPYSLDKDAHIQRKA